MSPVWPLVTPTKMIHVSFLYAEKAVQSYAALSVGFVCIVVGLPLWWKTTEVYRVQLPYSDITTLAEIQVQYSTTVSQTTFNSNS